MYINDSQFKEAAEKMAEQFGVDATVSENVFRGAIARIEAAVSKGEQITPELCQAAIIHYLEWSIKHSNDVLENKNGMRDKIENEVLKKLQEDSHCTISTEALPPYKVKVDLALLDSLPEDSSVISGDRQAMVCLEMAKELENGITELDCLKSVPSQYRNIHFYA